MRVLARAVLVLTAMSFATSAAAAVPPARPNIIFVMLDNCGQEWLGCYGSEEGRTPHIDRLAREGLRFEHCYTPPVCGPSRVVLLTGRYPFRTGFRLHHDAALYSGGGLDPDLEVCFSRLLRDAGYATAITGKWQVNNLYDEPGVLERHGFQQHLVWPGSLDSDKVSDDERRRFDAAIEAADVETTSAMINKIESRYWDPVFLRDGKREVHPDQFGPDVSQQYALEFLRRNRDRPFLLYYPMVLTHGQTFTYPVVATPTNRRADRPHHEMFGDMVAYADRQIGELVATLDELGLRENTYLFVATDNGTESSMRARQNGKVTTGGLYQLTEAGSDVALLVNAPGLVPGGRTVPLTDFTDVLPTMCELAGVPIPDDLVLDGHSQAAVIRGQAGAKSPRQWIFNQYHDRRLVRDERFKLYSTGELFDASTDPEELHDLSASRDADAVAAKKRLTDILASLPPDARSPIQLRSQSAFKLRQRADR